MRKNISVLLAIAITVSLACAACSNAAVADHGENVLPETQTAVGTETIPTGQESVPAEPDPLFDDEAVGAVFASVDELMTIFARDDIVTYGDTWADIMTNGVPAIRERGFQEIGFHYLLPPQNGGDDYRKSLKIGTIDDAVFAEFDLEWSIHWTVAAMKSDHPVMYLADKINGVKFLYSGKLIDKDGNTSPFGEVTDENGNTRILPLITENGGQVYGYQIFPSWVLENDSAEQVSWQEVWWIYFESTHNLYMMCSDYLTTEAWEDYREPSAMFNGAWIDMRDLPYVSNDGLNYNE